MNIRIKGKKGIYRITSDDRQYILEEEKVVQKDAKNSKKGDIYYLVLGYISSFSNLLNALLDLEIRRSDIETLEELKNEYKKTREYLKELLGD